MLNGKEVNDNWTKFYEHITKFKKQMDEKLKSSNARVYNLRLFDLILDNEKLTKPKVQVFFNCLSLERAKREIRVQKYFLLFMQNKNVIEFF